MGNLPTLACDTDCPLGLADKVERRIVWALLQAMHLANFAVIWVDDGEDAKRVGDDTSAMEAVFGCGVSEVSLFVSRRVMTDGTPPVDEDDMGSVILVLGNGEDVVSNWTYTTGDPDGFNAFMDEFIRGERW